MSASCWMVRGVLCSEVKEENPAQPGSGDMSGTAPPVPSSIAQVQA